MDQKNKPVVLVVMDGFGIPKDEEKSGITRENTKFLQEIAQKYGCSVLNASGEAVGLPKNQTGTSDIGHLTIGTGRINYQPLVRINKAIEDQTFFQNDAFLQACKNAKKSGRKLHIMGIVSDGGVHGHIDHIFALLKLVKKQKVKKVYLHLFTDGRDTPPKSARKYISKLERKIKELKVGEIASVSGRFYALDRDNNYDRNKLAYQAMVFGKGENARSAQDAISKAYERGETDEFILPTVIEKNNKPVSKIDDNDSVIFANYRADRERQLTWIFVEKNKLEFVKPMNLVFVTMTNYDNTFKKPIVAFDELEIKNTLSEVISRAGIKQAKIAETEKYAYVTYSFNAGKQDEYKLEERFLISSYKVKSFDQKPEMKAKEIAELASQKIMSGEFGFIVVNLANGDMVGHSGVKEATRKAIFVVDECIRKIVAATLVAGGVALITADHGNADIMEYADGSPNTAHTMAKVPAILVNSAGLKMKKRGNLADIAPTILELMKISKPKEMTGTSLIKA